MSCQYFEILDSNLESEMFGSPVSTKVDSGKRPGSDGLDHLKVFESKVRAPFSGGTGNDNVIVFDVISGHHFNDVFRGITFRNASLSTSRET